VTFRMEIDPPKRWKMFKLQLMVRWPEESRKKIKKLLRLGDDYQSSGEYELAKHCYNLSRELAQEAGAVHLLKKIDQRVR